MGSDNGRKAAASLPAERRGFAEKVVYFADPMLTFGCKTIEEEFKMNVELKLKLNRISFNNGTCTTIPPFKGSNRFDILFFDWGGMGIVDNRILYDNCRALLRDAEGHPSRFYVVVSAFTEMAMKDAMSEFAGTVPANVFLSIKDFSEYYRVYSGIKESRKKADKNKLHLLMPTAGKKRRGALKDRGGAA